MQRNKKWKYLITPFYRTIATIQDVHGDLLCIEVLLHIKVLLDGDNLGFLLTYLGRSVFSYMQVLCPSFDNGRRLFSLFPTAFWCVCALPGFPPYFLQPFLNPVFCNHLRMALPDPVYFGILFPTPAAAFLNTTGGLFCSLL